MKFAKRTLRVQRCKTLPGAKVKIATKASPVSKTSPSDGRKTPRQPPVPIVVPKGDPKLGERLIGLTKESRKEAKAKDAERIARRLAKKKAKNALDKSGVKAKDDMKHRMRERKKGNAKGTVNTGRKTGKPRMRSDRAAGMKNVKKQ